MEIQKLYKLRSYAEQLERGIDPTSGIEFSEDTIMNIPKIKKYNGEIRQFLDAIINLFENNGEFLQQRKIPFFMFKEQKELFEFFDSPVSISKFCHKLNEFASRGMKKIRGKDITIGLEKMGYLETKKIEENRLFKVPTKKGNTLGITQDIRKNKLGDEYFVNLYSSSAQQFILLNLEKILKEAKQ